MKKWSIRTKITLLFTVALTLMATLPVSSFFCQPPGHSKDCS